MFLAKIKGNNVHFWKLVRPPRTPLRTSMVLLLPWDPITYGFSFPIITLEKEFELLFSLNDSNFKSSLQYIALLALPTELDFWDDVGLNPAHTNKAPTNQMGNMCIYLLIFFGILHKLI